MRRTLVFFGLVPACLAAKSTTITVGGFVTTNPGGQQDAYLTYPDDAGPNKQYPLVAFAHGDGALPEVYTWAVLNVLADRGYVVISPNSCYTAGGGAAGWCQDFNEDQARAVEYAYQHRSSQSAHKAIRAVDWSKKVGLFGHSMGGLATLLSASGLSVGEIGAAVALNPYWDGSTDPGPAVSVPIMYATGEADSVAASKDVETFYDRTPSSKSKVLVDLQSATHTSIVSDPNFIGYVAAFFDCHLKDAESSSSGNCGVIYGNVQVGGFDPVCNNPYYKMAKCVYRQATLADDESEAVV